MSTFSDNTFFTLPEELAQTYDVVSCLKYADSNATYLLRDKNTGHFYLLKTAVDSVFAKLLWNEKNILELTGTSLNSTSSIHLLCNHRWFI